jgi:molybdopterin converting factor small subunit
VATWASRLNCFSSLREVLGESEFEFALTELDSAATVAAVKSALSQRGASLAGGAQSA